MAGPEELREAKEKIDWIVSPSEKLKDMMRGSVDEKITALEQNVADLKGMDYLSSKEKDEILEEFGEKGAEKVVANISARIKESELFKDRRDLGIDVWTSRLEDSKLPFALIYEGNPLYDSLKRKDSTSGAHFDRGMIVVNSKLPNMEVRLRNWVDGYDGDYALSHETLHGFQTADVKLLQEFAEIEMELESIDSAKLTHDDIISCTNKKNELKQRWAEKLGIMPNKMDKVLAGENPNDSSKDYEVRRALKEVHAYWASVNSEFIKDREQSIETRLLGGVYKLPIQAIRKGIELVAQLKALKIDDKTIGKLIFLTKVDLSSTEIFVDLEKFITEFKDKNKISKEMMRKLARLANLEEEKDLLTLKQIANQEVAKYYQENKSLKDAFRDLFRRRN